MPERSRLTARTSRCQVTQISCNRAHQYLQSSAKKKPEGHPRLLGLTTNPQPSADTSTRTELAALHRFSASLKGSVRPRISEFRHCIASLMPCLRHRPSTLTPASLRKANIWLSVNRDFFTEVFLVHLQRKILLLSSTTIRRDYPEA